MTERLYNPYLGSLATYGQEPEHLYFRHLARGGIEPPATLPGTYDTALSTLRNIATGSNTGGDSGGNTSHTGSAKSDASPVGPGPMGHDSMDEGTVSPGLGISLGDITPSLGSVTNSIGQAIGSAGGPFGAAALGTASGVLGGQNTGRAAGQAGGAALGMAMGNPLLSAALSYIGGKLGDSFSSSKSADTNPGLTETEADERAALDAMNLGLDPDLAIAAMTAARAAPAGAVPSAQVAPDLSGPLGSREVDQSPGNIGGYGGSAPGAFGNFPSFQSFVDFITGVAPAPWSGGAEQPTGTPLGGPTPEITGPPANYDTDGPGPAGGGGPTGGGSPGGSVGGDVGQGSGEVSGEGAPGGYAKGGHVSMQEGGFVVPADVVSGLGDGSTKAGHRRLGLGDLIEGPGTGMSDHIPATIDGEPMARVADGEVYLTPQEVAMVGGGDHNKGLKRLYALMSKVRKERHGTTKQPQPLALGDL